MSAKILISGQPNSGKTSLLQSLTDVLVISHDGKRYPFPQAHKNIPSFSSVEELITIIAQAVEAYKEKYKKFPKTVAIDSISKILLTIEGNILATVKSFPYGVINTEIKKLTDFLEQDLAPNVNLVMVSHTLFDQDTATYQLVNAGGSWGKKGGMISEVDNAVFIEIKNNKRIVHHRSPKLASRTVLAELPDSQPVDEYVLEDHVNALEALKDAVAEFEL